MDKEATILPVIVAPEVGVPGMERALPVHWVGEPPDLPATPHWDHREEVMALPAQPRQPPKSDIQHSMPPLLLRGPSPLPEELVRAMGLRITNRVLDTSQHEKLTLNKCILYLPFVRRLYTCVGVWTTLVRIPLSC